jgi:pimeloyl-ACP methyl ester carboxylesterase
MMAGSSPAMTGGGRARAARATPWRAYRAWCQSARRASGRTPHAPNPDLRNANGGESSGPLEVDRPWDSHTDDQLGLMDHRGIGRFMVLGFCIGGPFIWNLPRRAGDRVYAAVLAQPSGFRPELPDLFHRNNIKGWGPALCAHRPDITMEQIHAS